MTLATIAPATAPVLDVMIPVHNGATELYGRVSRLHALLAMRLTDPFRITIVDCASSDATALFALDLAADLPDITVRMTSDAATIVCVDLFADLAGQLARIDSAGR
jgi:hypothetical protein